MAIAIPDNVISHWSKLIENFQASPMEFYASVEAAIQRRQVPETATERIEYKQGLVSAHRIYFRVQRGRNVFDVCAAPFGTGFFFSSWGAEIPFLNGLEKFGLMMGLVVVFAFFVYNSLLIGPFLFLFCLLGGLVLIGMTDDSGAYDALLELPMIGWISLLSKLSS